MRSYVSKLLALGRSGRGWYPIHTKENLVLVVRSRHFIALALALLAGALTTPAVRGNAVIDANKFKYHNVADPAPDANDFHLIIDGKLSGDATCDGFPNSESTYDPATDTTTVNFSGAKVKEGAQVNVKFKSDKNKPNPRGWFTLNGEPIGDGNREHPIHSKALDDTVVAFAPNGLGGFDVSLYLGNQFGSPLAGFV